MELAELSIKVTIANRIYPLTIQADEEEMVRKAAKYVNESIKNYSENYATRDKQDLLAMVALEMAAKLLEDKNLVDTEDIIKKLSEVSKALTHEIDKL
jgi:cell division protein ZapA